jgi:isopropylmalate/homocitrate/citramalate synthase
MYIDIAGVYFYSLFHQINLILGYHVYKSIWTFEISEKLRCDREENNANDKFAVKLVRNDGNKEQCAGRNSFL